MKLLLSSVVETLPEVWLFLEKLSASVKAGTIRSKEQLIERCQEFYTAERMAEIEAVIPGWKHMASFEHGKTLWHINVAMVALLQLDEYLSMSPSQQTVQQWIVFLHDVAKEPVGGARPPTQLPLSSARGAHHAAARIPSDRRLYIGVPKLVQSYGHCNAVR
jgi:hypothetical protein